MLIYLALMAEAFMGYVLPCGNMSYWGAQVIINLFGTIPGIGPAWSSGSAATTASRCDAEPLLLAARVALPFIALLVDVHSCALRQVGSNNPDGIEIKDKLGPTASRRRHSVPSVLHAQGHRRRRRVPHAVRHRGVLRADVRRLFLEAPNFEPANPLSTPEHIAPVWYFTPYYAILRAVPDQKMGALLMALSVAAFLFLPWLDPRAEQVDPLPRPVVEAAAGHVLRHVPGADVAGPEARRRPYVMLARIFTVLYFAFFILLPFVSKADGNGPVPERVTYHAH
jgi:ubiquinol-cytochrome c reductase cytochrome b subunit